MRPTTSRFAGVKSCTARLGKHPTRVDGHCVDGSVRIFEPHVVLKIDTRADMVRNDVHAIAEFRRPLASTNVHPGVFFG